ncbi:hypothetical protein TNCV_2713591 [Trichonephila clavipes]|nr:hypothetical protein TNCV_2713591 [Trichonephila clavipes]
MMLQAKAACGRNGFLCHVRNYIAKKCDMLHRNQRFNLPFDVVTSYSPVPLKNRLVGQPSRWCGVVIRRWGASSGVIHVT